MKSTLLKPAFIKCIFGLILISIYMPAVSQTKDSAPKFIIRKSVTCEATLAGKWETVGTPFAYTLLTADEILKDPYVRATCSDYTVTSFAMVLTVNGNTRLIRSNCNFLSNEMIGFIKQIARGSCLIIEDVSYKSPDGKTGVIAGLNIQIIQNENKTSSYIAR